MGQINRLEGGQLSRFCGEQSPWHDGELIWPGLYGFPALGPINVSDSPKAYSVYYFFHSKLFNLDLDEDIKYYNWVQDRIKNGWFLQSHIEYKWKDDVLFVYLEWVQRYVKFIYVEPIEERPVPPVKEGLFL